MHDELSGKNGDPANFLRALGVGVVLFVVVAGIFWLVTPKEKQ
jgi:hypothetical protein